MPSPSVPTQMPARRRPRQPGSGSYRLLDWVARVGAAGIEPAGIALRVSPSVAYSHAQRLTAASYLRHVSVNDGAGGVVAVTPRGAALARERGVAAVTPRGQAPTTGVHARAVSWVAARAETEGWPWLGPAPIHHDSRWSLTRDD